MEVSALPAKRLLTFRVSPGAAGLAILLAVLCTTVGVDLWRLAKSDPALSHAPLIPLLTLVHLWLCRHRLRAWRSASPAGFLWLGGSALCFAAAGWADIEFLKPLALLGILIGVFWFLGGWQTLRSALGALGFLLFLVPFPTSLTARLQFPLQLISSAYAALLSGMLGLPVQREGVFLAVAPSPTAPPVYKILVAQQCSGLTSVLVLLTLGYLIACHTPVRGLGRVLLVAATLPLALCANALRLTLILVAGANHGRAFAQWVHDNEQPVLVFLCTLGLLGLRALLLAVLHGENKPSASADEAGLSASRPATKKETKKDSPHVSFSLARNLLVRYRWSLLNGILLIALAGSFVGRRADSLVLVQPDPLSRLSVPYRDWQESALTLSEADTTMLRPDATFLRRYTDAQSGRTIELAVVAGHRKQTVHLPSYCMAGGGWETLAQHDRWLVLPDRAVPAVEATLLRNGEQVLVLYLFTDGEETTRSLPAFQWQQFWKRLRLRPSLGALVRIVVPLRDDTARSAVIPNVEAAQEEADAFARAALPPILEALREARLEAQ